MYFNNHEQYSGFSLLFGAIFFAFQIYGDFSGYSDIAIGTSRLFGFDLMKNFAFPYFSRDIAEFWRRWHISLSTWFRDYVYIPLGGSRGSSLLKVRNVMIIFLVSGFWHGANWTFIIWGALNAIYFLPLLLIDKNRSHIDTIAHGRFIPGFREFLNMIGTFLITCFAWIFFRAESVSHALSYISKMFYGFQKEPLSMFSISFWKPMYLQVALLFIFVLIEWMGRENHYALEKIAFKLKYKSLRWAFYYIVIFTVFYFSGKPQEFIYFQF